MLDLMRVLVLAALTLAAAAPCWAAPLTPVFDEGCAALFDAKCEAWLPALAIEPLPLHEVAGPGPHPRPFVWLPSAPEAKGALVAALHVQGPVQQAPYLQPTDALLRAGWVVASLLIGWGVFRALLR